MTVIEYGQKNAETVILLHGGGLSWWNYRDVAAELEPHFHVVLPVLDGHGGSDAPFTSIEDNAARIISYIDTHCKGQVAAIGGLSLGAQIAAQILSQRPDICRYGLLESGCVKPDRLTQWLLPWSISASFGLVKRRWFSKIQAAYLGIPKALFEDYYRDTCAIQKADMLAFLLANTQYTCKPGLENTKARVKLLVGTREQKRMIDSAKLLHRAIPGSELELLPGLKHGQLSLRQPQRYGKLLLDWMGKE